MAKVKVSAPSNIALIKYMGKTEGGGNRPTNSSLSYTLPHLRSWVEIERVNAAEDQWAPLDPFPVLEMSPFSKKRYLDHARFLKSELGIEGSFMVRSANDFPSDCGLASSASSFAALTKAFVELAREMGLPALTDAEASALSRKGSGSSCRSFFAPWALWREERAEQLNLKFTPLIHQALVVQAGKKGVSSSEAHRRVSQSELFPGRPERAERRLTTLIKLLSTGDKNNWKEIFNLCWLEFQDMHALFETCPEPFGYLEPKSLEVLSAVREIWSSQNDGPLVTMDAGPNVHLLWRPDQELQAKVFESTWKVRHRIFSSGVPV